LIIDTDELSVEESVDAVIEQLEAAGFIDRDAS
jgi:hypothetical protein